MQEETIDAIINLAISAYNKKSKPGEFARAAAHKAALDAAKQHYPDLADFATLNAAAFFYLEVTAAIRFTSEVTDKAVTLVGAHNNYQALWENYSHTTIPAHITTDYFQQLAQSPDKISKAFIESVSPTYDTTSVLDVVARNKAKRAALYVYLDTYAVARSAYIRALFISQNNSRLNAADIFSKSISKRLKRDLTYDIIYPNLILQLLNTIIFKALITIILLASIAGIALAALHLTPLPFIPLISASCGATAVSIGLLSGSFFASKKCSQIAVDNENRAETALFY